MLLWFVLRWRVQQRIISLCGHSHCVYNQRLFFEAIKRLVTSGVVGVERGGERPRSRGRTSNVRKSEAGGFCSALKARSAGPFRCGYVDRGQKEANGKPPSAERTFLARVYTKGDACRADQNADANLESRAAICSGVAK